MKRSLLALAMAASFSSALQAETAADAATDKPPRDHAAHQLDAVQVTAMPIQQDAETVIAPVSVLSGAELDDAKAATLGETVAREAGVQTTFFGAGVGRPVIRGMEGARVGVLSNGSGSGDVSTVSQDHAVAIDPFLADQIEILKGPATLLYGSGAIGGAVNVVDGRIAERLPERAVSGRAELRGNSNTNERSGMARLDVTAGDFVLHADGVHRETDDYDGPDGTVPNSALTTKAGSFGASWIGTHGFIGVSVSRFLNRYGNPAEPGDPATGEPGVTLDLDQTRHDLRAAWHLDESPLESVRVDFGHTDYSHTEFEGDEVGTVFLNTANEGRVELIQRELDGWRGAFGAQFLRRDFQAIGEEAFVPHTLTRSFGLFALQQREWSRLKVDFGARAEKYKTDPQGPLQREFSPVSFSAGLAFEISEPWHVQLNLDRAQRAPAEEELFANGPHVATDSFEIGLPDARKETSSQVELGLHYHSDFVSAKVSGYINRFDDFIYLANTGEVEDELPVRQWSQDDARFRGVEADATFELGEAAGGHYDWRVWGDLVRARLDDGTPLPRIAPARLGTELKWSADAWRASLGIVRYRKQDRTAPLETPTDGFTLVNAHVSYTLETGDTTSWEIFADGTNLGNQEARLSTSYIKDAVPLPGRAISFGVRAFF
ncbi:TonB-dependent receptor [Tahibacter amnicola]|uniref:TonB-dependent receptor n=1 Tax=Tahibacter amnicola TaxID=2976241 RepID=A0ABY6BAJ9_9GAMM|nr:TonB-dependent receptor [Tahibacter amnicola]UXI67084.1 TonB-dependent receptor [Tahibacter amnicola]